MTNWIESIYRLFYAATLSIDSQGGLLLVSSRERMLIWGLTFCILALISFVLWQLKIAKRTTRGVFFVSLLIPVFIMPSLKHERIHVTTDRLTIHSGYWFNPTIDVIELDRRDSIRQEKRLYTLTNIISPYKLIWNITRQDGNEKKVELNGFFIDHEMTVAAYLADRGFDVDWQPYLR